MLLITNFKLWVFSVPTNISIAGSTVATEGTNVTLICEFTDSFPLVNNVTFIDNGRTKSAVRVIFFFCNIKMFYDINFYETA